MDSRLLLPPLPTVLSLVPRRDPDRALDAVLADSQWVDAVSQASLTVGRPLPESRQAFEALLRDPHDAGDRAVLLAAVARCANSQMRLLEGGGLLRQAWEHLAEAGGDRRVFVQLEVGRFLLLIGSLDGARSLLNPLPELAEGNYLRRLATYYLLALGAAGGDPNAAEGLRDSKNWFQAQGHLSTVVAHVRMLASLDRAVGKPEEARALLQTQLRETRGRPLAFCRALLHNDLAHLAKAQGRLDEALAELDLSLAEAEFPYARIDALDLKGRFLLDAGRLEEAAERLGEALRLARESGTLIILPALAHHLGLCHARLGDETASRECHAQAYDSAMSLLQHGFPATQVRLQAIQAHTDLLRRAVQETPALAPSPEEEFTFALDRSLKEIRELTRAVLFDQALAQWGTARRAARELGMSERTAGNITRRRRAMDWPATGVEGLSAIRLQPRQSWREQTRQLDDRILLWLARRHRGRLQELSRTLDTSYTHLSSLLGDARRRASLPTTERQHASA